MNEQLENLIRLQELDLEIGKLTQKMAGIAPQIEETRIHLAAAERALAEGKAAVEKARKDHRAAEKELENQIEKRRKFQEQQSKVKTNKEYQALMGELENLKREETGVEDQILAQMEAQAEAEKLLPGMAAEVAREKVEFAQKEQVLRVEEDRLRAELDVAQERRAAVVAAIDPAQLQSYQKIQKLRGSAVVEVRDEFCFGCRTKLTAQNYMDVMRSDKILSCPNCHRILYYVRPEVRPPAPAAVAGATWTDG